MACGSGVIGPLGEGDDEDAQSTEVADGAVGVVDAVGAVDAVIVDAAPQPPDATPPPDAFRPGCVEGAMQAYQGDIHVHTNYSDGDGTPAQVIAAARDEAHFDFISIEDHLSQLSSTELSQCWTAADAADQPGLFSATCGYEVAYSNAHANFLFARARPSSSITSIRDLYAKAVACSECVLQINHPTYAALPWTDYAYVASAEPALDLIETNWNFVASWEKFIEMLDNGWHLGPTRNSDKHDVGTTPFGDNVTGLWLRALNRDEIRAAMREHRSFASQDANAALSLRADGCMMGSVLPGWIAATLQVEATDPDATDGFTQVTIHGPGGAVIASQDCGGTPSCVAAFPFTVAAPTYVVARAAQSDGANLASSPIWFVP